MRDWFAERVEVTGATTDTVHSRTLWEDFDRWSTVQTEGIGSHAAAGHNGPDVNFYRELAVRLRGLKHNDQLMIDGKRSAGYYGVRLRENVI
jgi:hypothetical protein